MQLHTLTKSKNAASTKRVGRGGKRGKTSGKGHKGQKARAGHRIRPEIRDMIKKLPKLRGHGKNRARTVNSGVLKPVVINLATLEKHYASQEEVSPKTLAAKGLISGKEGRRNGIKILGTGEISKPVIVRDCLLSATARAAIEKAGGSIQ